MEQGREIVFIPPAATCSFPSSSSTATSSGARKEGWRDEGRLGTVESKGNCLYKGGTGAQDREQAVEDTSLPFLEEKSCLHIPNSPTTGTGWCCEALLRNIRGRSDLPRAFGV